MLQAIYLYVYVLYLYLRISTYILMCVTKMLFIYHVQPLDGDYIWQWNKCPIFASYAKCKELANFNSMLTFNSSITLNVSQSHGSTGIFLGTCSITLLSYPLHVTTAKKSWRSVLAAYVHNGNSTAFRQ